MSITVESSPSPVPEVISHLRRDRSRRIDLLSRLIRQDLGLMTATDVSSDALKDGVDQLRVQIDEACSTLDELGAIKESCSAVTAAAAADDDQAHLNLERDLQRLMKKVSKLKSVFPFSVVIKPTPLDSHFNRRDRSTPYSVSAAPDKLMQNLERSNRRTPTVEELESSLRGLKSRLRMCLICFLVFPENAIIKKSLLVCWAKANHIDFLDEPMDALITKGLIQPVYKDTLTVGGYWMHPFVRSTLIDQNRLQVSSDLLTQWVYVADSTTEEDIIYYDPAQFLAKKELRMLHLGNWQRSSVRHIEVEDPDLFFKDMAQLTKLRYVSLRGISLVTEIPRFIMKQENLEILDLKNCHNLEVFPSDIGNLWCSLTHLDMSECYFLEHMPKALSRLHNLRVLKGFFVGENERVNSCTLEDLLNLVDLMKLSICTSDKSFPDGHQLYALHRFKSLRSLTISWGKSEDFVDTNVTEDESEPPIIRAARLFKKAGEMRYLNLFNLEKLDLQCFPKTVTPDWFKPTYVKNLKNLYIRGGQFSDLGKQGGERTEEYQWNVEILRLKHLSNLEMDYSELVRFFPKLICLETVECPKLTNFPFGDSVWKDTTAAQPPPTTYH